MENNHLSFSQINLRLGCQKQYSYQRIEKSDSIDVNFNLIIGSAYHTVLEMFFRAKMNNESQVQINEMINLFEYLLLEEEDEKIRTARMSYLTSKSLLLN
jgi:hypothetical protein